MSVGQRWGNRVCWQDSINSTITIPGEMPPSFWLSRSALKSHCPWLLKAACFSSYLLNFCPIFILDWLFATPGMNIAILIPGWAGIYVGNAERWVRSQAVREKLSSKGMFKQLGVRTVVQRKTKRKFKLLTPRKADWQQEDGMGWVDNGTPQKDWTNGLFWDCHKHNGNPYQLMIILRSCEERWYGNIIG